jgi:TonB family protein
MLSFLLKKIVPFLLTLTTGIVLGNLFGVGRAPKIGTSQFGIRVYRGEGCRHRHEEFSDAWDYNSPVIIKSKPRAEYTEEARRNHTTGTVELRMMLNRDGSITDIQVEQGLPDGLTEKAIEAAHDIQFTPAYLYGRPTDAKQRVEYHFDGSPSSDGDGLFTTYDN